MSKKNYALTKFDLQRKVPAFASEKQALAWLSRMGKMVSAAFVLLGFQPAAAIDYAINSRAMSRWGKCSRVSPSSYVIEISSRLLSPSVSVLDLVDTLAHEIIHTMPGGMNHGPAFKAAAQAFNAKFGTNIKRVTTPEEKGLEDVRVRSARPYRYEVFCPNCDNHGYYKVMSKTVLQADRRLCGKCGSRLVSRDLLSGLIISDGRQDKKH